MSYFNSMLMKSTSIEYNERKTNWKVGNTYDKYSKNLKQLRKTKDIFRNVFTWKIRKERKKEITK